MQPFFKDVAQHAQAAALELASYKARVKFEFLQEGALNFAGISRVHILWSSWVQELRVCHEIDEFCSLQRARCRFEEKSLNSFQGQAEETLIWQSLCHLAVNVLRTR